jgi:hypothetical protein
MTIYWDRLNLLIEALTLMGNLHHGDSNAERLLELLDTKFAGKPELAAAWLADRPAHLSLLRAGEHTQLERLILQSRG